MYHNIVELTIKAIAYTITPKEILLSLLYIFGVQMFSVFPEVGSTCLVIGVKLGTYISIYWIKLSHVNVYRYSGR